jgi:hypothetical protein
MDKQHIAENDLRIAHPYNNIDMDMRIWSKLTNIRSAAGKNST